MIENVVTSAPRVAALTSPETPVLINPLPRLLDTRSTR